MVRTLVTAWQQWRAAQLSVESENAAVQSASVEFEGMGKEYKAAERSTLDVLSAEEALVTAELALNAARRDAYIYKAAVLQNMGRLEIANLTQIDRAYDPDAHLKAVMPKISPILDAPLEKLDGLGGKPVKSMSVTSNGG
jgi:outer membrane protein